MISFSKTAFKACRTMQQNHRHLIRPMSRSFGAMDQINRDLFEHKFTEEMDFKSSFDKIKCFRIMDEEGNIVTPGYEN